MSKISKNPVKNYVNFQFEKYPPQLNLPCDFGISVNQLNHKEAEERRMGLSLEGSEMDIG